MRYTFAYDEVGSRTQMQDGTGLYTYTFDALNRQESKRNPASIATTYSYDSLGQLESKFKSPNRRTSYSYDALGRLESQVNSQGERTTSTYDAVNRRTLLRMADGSRTSFTFDAAGWHGRSCAVWHWRAASVKRVHAIHHRAAAMGILTRRGPASYTFHHDRFPGRERPSFTTPSFPRSGGGRRGTRARCQADERDEVQTGQQAQGRRAAPQTVARPEMVQAAQFRNQESGIRSQAVASMIIPRQFRCARNFPQVRRRVACIAKCAMCVSHMPTRG